MRSAVPQSVSSAMLMAESADSVISGPVRVVWALPSTITQYACVASNASKTPTTRRTLGCVGPKHDQIRTLRPVSHLLVATPNQLDLMPTGLHPVGFLLFLAT